ncbi:MAG: nucleotidyltransferase [Firmicutes bacterium]|nr:nucleotidyltransferase [Bacillota bacterium]
MGPLCAVLIGSVARGDFNLSSDIDVIIVSDRLPTPPLERSRFLYRYILPDIEPKGFLPAEFMRDQARQNSLVLEALSHGILFADNGFWAEIVARR